MKTKEINVDNVKIKEIDEEVTRVNAFIINSHDEILIASSNGGCQLPGGHVEEGEDIIETVKREVMEETGIILDENEISKPFFRIQHKTRNYRNTGKNRLSNVIYFLVKTDKSVNLNNIKLTENEKECNFSVKYVKIQEFENHVNSFINSTQIEVNKIIAEEMLIAFDELKLIL